jgi:hypothetical protein
MANRERGQTRMSVEGRDYTLHLTTNAQCELEDRLSTPEKRVGFRQIFMDINSGNVTAMRAFVWACLLEHHGDEIKTDKDAGHFIDKAGGMDAVMGAMLAAVKASEPEKSDLKALDGGKSANPPTAQRSGTGTRSTEPVIAPA